jgi:hypothetical protein
LHFSEANWRRVRIDTCWGSLQALLQTSQAEALPCLQQTKPLHLTTCRYCCQGSTFPQQEVSTSQVHTSWCRRQLGAGGELKAKSQAGYLDVQKVSGSGLPDKLQLPIAPRQIEAGKLSESPHVHAFFGFWSSDLPSPWHPSQAASPVEKSCCASRRAGGGIAPNQLRGLAGHGFCPELEGSSIRPAWFDKEEAEAPAKQWRRALKTGDRVTWGLRFHSGTSLQTSECTRLSLEATLVKCIQAPFCAV